MKTRNFALFETLTKINSFEAFLDAKQLMQANPSLLLYIAYLLINKTNQMKPVVNDEEYTVAMLKPESSRFLAFKEYLNIVEIMHMIIIQVRSSISAEQPHTKLFNELQRTALIDTL